MKIAILLFAILGNTTVGLRQLASENQNRAPEYSITKTAQITNNDGTAVKLNLVKFKIRSGEIITERSLVIGGFTNGKDEIIVQSDDGKTVSEAVLLHELWHLTTMYDFTTCKDILSSNCQERGAYNFEELYGQIINLQKQGWITLK